jgi:hypothetical protein
LIVQFGLVAARASHSSDVEPSAAPALVSNAVFTAASRSVTVKPVVVEDRALTILVRLALERGDQDTSKPFCPIVPSMVRFSREVQVRNQFTKVKLSESTNLTIVCSFVLPSKTEAMFETSFVRSIGKIVFVI